MSDVRSVTVHCRECRKQHDVSAFETFGGLSLVPSRCTDCGASLTLPVKVQEEIHRENLRRSKRY